MRSLAPTESAGSLPRVSTGDFPVIGFRWQWTGVQHPNEYYQIACSYWTSGTVALVHNYQRTVSSIIIKPNGYGVSALRRFIFSLFFKITFASSNFPLLQSCCSRMNNRRPASSHLFFFLILLDCLTNLPNKIWLPLLLLLMHVNLTSYCQVSYQSQWNSQLKSTSSTL